MLNKKGVSAVVATVLIVMITVAAAGLLWTIVSPFLKSSIADKSACVEAEMSIYIDSASKYTCTSLSGTAVRVKRGADKQEWYAVQIIYGNDEGSSIKINYADVPSKNSEKVYRNTGMNNITELSVVPIIAGENDDIFCSKTVVLSTIKDCISEVADMIESKGTSPEYIEGTQGLVTGLVTTSVSCSDYDTSPVEVCSCDDLQNMDTGLTLNYTMTYDINFSEEHCSEYITGEGFDPVGDSTNNFEGTFDGQGYVIDGLYINRTTDNIGLFGSALNVEISNVELININVIGNDNVGGLVGYSANSFINNSYSSGIVIADDKTGGLIGWAIHSSIDSSYASVDVTGDASGDDYSAGGLMGRGYNSSINSSYSTGDVTGDDKIGGLVGDMSVNSSIYNSYSTGDVVGDDHIGGLVGYMYSYSSTVNSYSTGDVTGDDNIGGLIGKLYDSIINNSYSTGNIDASSDRGGFVGFLSGSILTNNYWLNTTGNPNDCYQGGNDGCNGSMSDVTWFYNLENAPMNVWSIDIWTNTSHHPKLI